MPLLLLQRVGLILYVLGLLLLLAPLHLLRGLDHGVSSLQRRVLLPPRVHFFDVPNGIGVKHVAFVLENFK